MSACLATGSTSRHLRRRNVPVDGEIDEHGGTCLFLQTFIKRGPTEIFFEIVEIVERRGYHGFGEGNLIAPQHARTPHKP